MGVKRKKKSYRTDKATSRRMSAVRPVDTAPELLVRKILTSMKLRYRLHGYGLPGRPDIVMRRRNKVIFIHGCYWHRHLDCPRATTPVRNASLWNAKFEATVERDRRNVTRLTEAGWQHLVLWECQLRNEAEVRAIISDFLDHEC